MWTVSTGALVAAVGGLACLSMPGAASDSATTAQQATIILRPSAFCRSLGWSVGRWRMAEKSMAGVTTARGIAEPHRRRMKDEG